MQQPISRRRLLQGSAAAAAAVGISRFTALSYGQIVGANSDVRMAVIGFRGRGNSHIDAWRHIKGVRLVALCEADEDVLNKGYARVMRADKPTTRPSTQPSSESAAVELPAPKPMHVEKYGDVRKLLENKDIDGVSIATPNHWHALMTIWGCQAGKDVYCEKPTCHDIFEGRKAVEAARKYNRIVQAGTQNRSSGATKEGIEWMQAGNLGKVLVARGLCYKRRQSIGKLDGEPKVPTSVNLDLWCGPSPLEKPHRKDFHYEWHWFWNTGNGDIGNQGIHQMDIARWALNNPGIAPSIISVGGRFGYEDDGQTPNTQFAVHNYGEALLIFEVRGLPVHPGSSNMDKYMGESTGNVIECEGGTLRRGEGGSPTAYDKDDKKIKSFDGKSEHDGEGKYEGDHFANFINAVRSRKVTDLHADIEKGFLSSALCHTSNISYRLGQHAEPDAIKEAIKADSAATETFERFKDHLSKNEVDISMSKATLGMPLKFDPKAERFVDNDKANALLKSNYRKGFVVPDQV